MPIDSFGDILQSLRKRSHISQRTLAERLGVHRNTIWSWEQGNYLPDSKSMVLEVARLLDLSETETRQLLEASLTALAPYWSVPYQRNAFFTGRDAFIDLLHQKLGTNQGESRTRFSALYGLGGVGKTQVALEYAFRYALEYRAIFWVEAETAESILASMKRIAAHLQLPEQGETDQQRIVIAVQRWLAANGEWLLIWDNVEDPTLLQQFLPSMYQGAILITTRRHTLGTLAHCLELPPMARQEGTLFVLRRAQLLIDVHLDRPLAPDIQALPLAWGAAQELVQVMGGLPLALDQAGAYIEETGCSFLAYLQHYKQQRTALLDRRGTTGNHHPHTVATTLALAYAQVKQHNPHAADVLHLCAFLSAEHIPEEFFLDAITDQEAGADFSSPDPFVLDAFQFDQAMATLRNFSLVQRQPETRTISLHRLVQITLQAQMDEQEHLTWQRRVIQRLNTLFPEPAYEVWERCERVLPHVLACLLSVSEHPPTLELAHLLQKVADYLRERNQYEQSEQLYRQALYLLEQEAEAQPLLETTTLQGLAILSTRQGKHEQARLFYGRTLDLREHFFGPEHPLVAQTLNVLGLYYAQQGEYEQAEQAYQRALAIRKQVFGAFHLLVASPLSNLAELYYLQGQYARAEALYQQTLQIWLKTLPPHHPQLWEPLYGLAAIAKEQRRYKQAEALYQRSLHLLEQTGESENPYEAFPLNGLADLACEREHFQEAAELYQRALTRRMRRLGPYHLETAQTLQGLAELCARQEQYEQAERLYKQTLVIRKRQLGGKHPLTASTLAGLAVLYRHQERPRLARTLYQQALSIWKQRGEETHPHALLAQDALIALDREQDRSTQIDALSSTANRL